MPLSEPIQQVAIYSVSPYALKDLTIGGVDFKKGQFFGTFQVIGDCLVNYAATSVVNRGGSSLFARKSEVVEIDTESTLTIKESPDMLWTLFGGGSISKTAAAALGSIVALANVNGTSLLDATTGITTATILESSEPDLRFNKWVVKVITTTTVNVYGASDIDYAKAGTSGNISPEDDLLLINSTPLTIPDTGGTVTVPGIGVEFKGGSGTVSMKVDDTATFKTTGAHGGISTITLGQKGLVFPEFGLVLYPKVGSDGTRQEIELFKVKASSGMPITLPEADFQVFDLSITALLNNNPLDGSGIAKLAEIRNVLPPV